MTPERLEEILAGFDTLYLLVVGDLFLDKYLMIDPALAEISLETGLEAHQVVEMRTSPGAAGTVMANLAALEVRQVAAVSVVGRDGEAFDLRLALGRHGLGHHLYEDDTRRTPTYTKPMRLVPGGPAIEMNRLDHKNRTPLPQITEAEVCRQTRQLVASQVGPKAIILADQVEERNCGVITDAFRSEIARLAEQHPETVFFADSRVRIGEFRGCLLKPNLREAALSLDPSGATPINRENAEAAARTLAARNAKPVFLTLGEDGMLVVEGDRAVHVPGVPVSGPVDPVGAGDSATAGIASALCAGATPIEAAVVGNLVASLTVQQLGTTGTTTRSDVLRQFVRHQATLRTS